MTLQLSATRIQLSMEVPLSPNAAQIEEGQALQWTSMNGQNYVTQGTGTAGQFAGVAFGYFMRPNTGVVVDTLTVPATAPYTVTLSQSPNNVAAVSVVSGSTQFTQVTSLTAASQYTIGGSNNQTLTFDSANAGATVTVTYRMNLTVFQAEMYTGDGYIVNAPSNVTGTIGVIQKGVVMTSNFDTSVYWGAGNINNITCAAGGYFTTGGSGAAVNATVYSVPTQDMPYLGLNIIAA